MSALTSSSADDMFGRFNKELFRNVTAILFFKKKESQNLSVTKLGFFLMLLPSLCRRGGVLVGFVGYNTEVEWSSLKKNQKSEIMPAQGA